MKSFAVILLVISIIFTVGCAGMDPRYQSNMTSNAVGWGALGAIAGAGISVATGGNAGIGALWGGLAGATLGIVNTPPPGAPYYPYYQYQAYPYGYPPRTNTCYERYRICDRYQCWFEYKPVPCW